MLLLLAASQLFSLLSLTNCNSDINLKATLSEKGVSWSYADMVHVLL